MYTVHGNMVSMRILACIESMESMDSMESMKTMKSMEPIESMASMESVESIARMKFVHCPCSLYRILLLGELPPQNEIFMCGHWDWRTV